MCGKYFQDDLALAGARVSQEERMKLKASVDYGARAIVYLAVKGGTCSSREISEEMSVPRDYLIQLALRLRKAGLIKARPGKNGGYVLAKDPSKISIAQVLNAFDADLKHERQNMKKTRKEGASAAMVRDIHGTIMDSLDVFLESITIQDMLDAYNEGVPSEMLMADALEKEAQKLRARAS